MKASIQVQVHTYDDGTSSYLNVSITGFEDGDMHQSIDILKVQNKVEHPEDDGDLCLWAIRALRNVTRNLEDKYVYTEQRPSALLLENLRKQ